MNFTTFNWAHKTEIHIKKKEAQNFYISQHMSRIFSSQNKGLYNYSEIFFN